MPPKARRASRRASVTAGSPQAAAAAAFEAETSSRTSPVPLGQPAAPASLTSPDCGPTIEKDDGDHPVGSAQHQRSDDVGGMQGGDAMRTAVTRALAALQLDAGEVPYAQLRELDDGLVLEMALALKPELALLFGEEGEGGHGQAGAPVRVSVGEYIPGRGVHLHAPLVDTGRRIAQPDPGRGDARWIARNCDEILRRGDAGGLDLHAQEAHCVQR